MRLTSHLSPTLSTLGVGLVGAVIARALSLPIPELTGPAIAVSLAGLWGMHLHLNVLVRNVAFVVLGISIGAGMTAETTQMMLRLPLAFIAVALSTFLGLAMCWYVLVKVFGFDRRAGLLAASPGHLSFVLSMGAQYDLDLPRITIVQSIRLLALTLLTPAIAFALGISPPTSLAGTGTPMAVWIIVAIAAVSYIVSLGLERIKTPAPLLIGAMLVSMIGHGSAITEGVMPSWLALPAFVVLGTLIGTRFGGVTLTDLANAAVAGGVATAITTCTAFAFAIAVAAWMGLPLQELLIAFAPGGLETMVAMSVAMGINSGFVVACHLARLLVLSALVPLLFARTKL